MNIMSTVPGVTDTSTSSAASAASAMKKEIGMDKDDFLKLFISQLQNQDPLSPQDPSQFLGQLAQLTQVEQAYNTTTALNSLLTAQNNSLGMNSVGFIGKEVTASGSQIPFDGTNTSTLSYQMPVAASSAVLNITNSSGQTVRTVNLGDLNAGNGSYDWDGKDGQGNTLSAGAYSFSISGTDAAGGKQTATTYITGKADGVTFENGAAYITIGAVRIPLSNVKTVKG